MKHTKQMLAFLLSFLLLLTALPGMTESGKVTVLGKAYPADTQELNLDNTRLRDETQLLKDLKKLPNLKSVSLENTGLKAKHLSNLFDAFPEVMFLASFELFGVPLHTTQTEADLGNAQVTGYQTFQWGINAMPNLTHMKAFGATLTQVRYEEILTKHPGLKLDCTLRFLRYSARTDITAFSTRKGNEAPFWKNKDFEVLKHFPNLKALDLGHNRVNDLSFLRQWPGLKILIMADNAIEDLSVIGEMTELEYLELFMNPFTDVSPLVNLTKLKDLNIAWTSAADVSPLSQMTWLERLWLSNIKPKLPEGQVDALRAALPNTEINDTARLATQEGWRDHPRYLVQANIFGTRIYRDWDEPADPNAKYFYQ